MIKSKKSLLSSFLTFAMVAGIIGVIAPTAFAASTYAVTNATATVGTETALEIEYTVDTSVQTWADADTLTLQLPANYPQWASLTYTVEYDSDTDNDGTGETAIAAGAGNGEYAVAADTMTVKWDVSTWGAVADGASTIRILISATDSKFTYTDATSTFTFGGATADGGDTDPSGTDDVAVSAGDAAASVTLGANSVVQTAGDTTLTLTIPIDLANGDTIVFTMPDNLDVSSVTYDSTTFAGTGFSACADALQVVTCTVDTDLTAGTGTVVMTGILADYAATGQTVTSLAVNDTSAAGADIVTDASGTVTDTTADALATTSVTRATGDAIVSNPVTQTIAFTTSVDIPNLGTVKLTYPEGWNVAALDGTTASSLSNMDGTWTASVSGQVVTYTQTGGGVTSAAALSFTTGTLYNWEGIGDAVNLTITTTNVAGSDLETDTAVDLGTTIGGGTSGDDDDDTVVVTGDDDDDTTEVTGDDDDETTEVTGDDDDDTTEETIGDDDDETSEESMGDDDDDDDSDDFSDTSEHWARTQIRTMVNAGILMGNPDGTFAPDDNLNRAEAAALLYRVLGLEDPTEPTEDPFDDVEMGEWYAGYVAGLLGMELVNGNPDGTYQPGEMMNRAEFLVLAMNVYRYMAGAEAVAELDDLMESDMTDDFEDLEDDWYTSNVTAAAGLGFVHGSECNGNGMCFNAEANITRAEATVMLQNMFGTLLGL